MLKKEAHPYRMNYLELEQMIENLVILLDDEVEESDDGEINCLPTEVETMDLLQASDESTPTDTKFTPQQPVAVIWHSQNDELDWSVGFFLDDVEDETCRIDHLCSKDKTNWIRPSFDDIQVVKYIQILPIDVDGDWDFSARHCTFTIRMLRLSSRRHAYEINIEISFECYCLVYCYLLIDDAL